MNIKLSRLRNIYIDGRRTSIRIEDAYWNALQQIARRSSQSVHDLCSSIYRRKMGSLSAEIRLFVLATLQREVDQRQQQAEL